MTPDITTKTISPVSSIEAATTAEVVAASTTTSLSLPPTSSSSSSSSPQQPTQKPSPALAPAAALTSAATPTPAPAKASAPASTPAPPPAPAPSPSPSSSALVSSPSSIMRRHLLTIEKLRNRVHQILKCVINLHIDILVLESNVNQLLDDVKELNADLMEVQRLDNLIQTLRDYNGPTICHEWPFPLVFQGTIDEADLAQTLNSSDIFSSA